jgi:hypothetical protein
MMSTTFESVENNREPITALVETSGVSFADGSALEPVSSSSGNQPGLLLWANGKATLAAHTLRDGKVYIPARVDPTIWAAMTLPTEAVNRGPSANLFSETAQLVTSYLGMSSEEAALATAWVVTTWFVDVLSNPPTLFIHSRDMNAAMLLLTLFSCITRHPLVLTEITRAAFRSLMAVAPTLLLNQPQMSPRFRAMCCASNYRGLFLPDIRGRVVDVVSSKAIFVGNTAGARRDDGIHLYLPTRPRDLPALDQATQVQIKERFQPWYLWHRLNHLPEVRQSHSTGSGLPPPDQLGEVLQSCTRSDSQLTARWISLLRKQEQNALAEQFWDPLAAMLEVLWPRLHSSEKSISMKELTDLTNTLLRSRGENREYSPEELGIKLGNEGVLRIRRNSGMFLTLDRQTPHRLHQLARNLGVGKKVSRCRICKELQLASTRLAEVVESVDGVDGVKGV